MHLGRAAIENADAIAAVPGIDVLLIGTNDLCLGLGVPGELRHARVGDAYRQMVAACHAHVKWAGMGGVYDEPLMQRYVDLGVRFILGGGNLGFLVGGAERRATFLRGLDRRT